MHTIQSALHRPLTTGVSEKLTCMKALLLSMQIQCTVDPVVLHLRMPLIRKKQPTNKMLDAAAICDMVDDGYLP